MAGFGLSVPFDHDNDGAAAGDPDAFRARHLFAKHLYVLMMAIKPNDVYIDFDGDGTPTPEETAYGIAQWAINVVDFRDADSINTPFEFDIEPFNEPASFYGDAYGWDVDGNLTSDPNRTGSQPRVSVGMRAARTADYRGGGVS